MKLEFFGVRGSMPVSGKNMNKYGGHTPCIGVITAEEEWIIIDSGTGIKHLGEKLERQSKGKPYTVHLFFTHFHLDHIIGLPFFAPLYASHVTLNIYAACSPEETERNLAGVMAGRYFPLEFNGTPSKKIFKDISNNDIRVGDTDISCYPLNHPQGSVSYRIRGRGKTIVLATDTESGDKEADERLITFCRGADILVYDAMFTPEEYEAGRKGWGHSTWLEGVKMAKAAAVGSVYLSHFNPDHDDKMIEDFISKAQKMFPQTFGAQEGQKISL